MSMCFEVPVAEYPPVIIPDRLVRAYQPILGVIQKDGLNIQEEKVDL